MTLRAYSVDSNTVEKDEQGKTLIRLPGYKFTENTILFITPYAKNGKSLATTVPTVVAHSENLAVIADLNAGEDYYLNVLVTEHSPGLIYGLPAAIQYARKKAAGALAMTGLAGEQAGSLLTSISWGGNDPVGYVETVTDMETFGGDNSNRVSITSQNAGDNYIVNHLSVRAGSWRDANGDVTVEAGTHRKFEKTVRVRFQNPWVSPPVVFVTPFWPGQNTGVEHVETVTKVTNEYFDVKSDNPIRANCYINWLAVKEDSYPTMAPISEEHVDKAFEHMFGHFPEHKDKMNEHRATLKHMILADGEPTEALKNVPFDNRPTLPDRTRFKPNARSLAIGAICIDSISILLSVIGIAAGSKLQSSKVVKALAQEFEESSETDQLVAVMDDLKKAEMIGKRFKQARAGAAAVIGVSGAMFAAGVAKTALIQIAEGIPLWQWFFTGLKLLAQLTAFVVGIAATAGSAAAAEILVWTARITAVINAAMSVEQLVFDVKRYRNLPDPAPT